MLDMSHVPVFSPNVPVGIQYYNTAGTYTFITPKGVTRLFVHLRGAGGGSGGANPSGLSKSGGPGGGTFDIVNTRPGVPWKVVVGAGGAAGVSGGPTTGSAGGVTTFGTLQAAILTANGGGGGGHSVGGEEGTNGTASGGNPVTGGGNAGGTNVIAVSNGVAGVDGSATIWW